LPCFDNYMFFFFLNSFCNHHCIKFTHEGILSSSYCDDFINIISSHLVQLFRQDRLVLGIYFSLILSINNSILYIQDDLAVIWFWFNCFAKID
jgi:hypothetical protein